MATSYYSTGTVSLTNGSAVVTGVGTLWQTALIAAGDIYIEAPGGNVLPILSVDSETQITAELKWMGASGTYNYAIERKRADAENLDKNSESLSYLISELRNGTLFKYDASGDLAGRGLYDTKPKGFGYLVTIGVTEPDFYVKGSAADGDWEGPFAYGVGPVGPQGPVGFLDFKGDYNPATAYVANDGVRYNGSSFVALQDTTGDVPPTLPTTENAYWSLLAIKGQDGTGIGDMVKSVYDPQNRQADVFKTYVAKSESYTAVTADFNDVLRFTAAATLNLAPAATLSANWHITVVADGGAVLIDPNGLETINGVSAMIVPDGCSAEIICDGSAFFTVIRPSGFQPIERRTFTGVNAVDFNNLGGWKDLQIRGNVSFSGNADFYWRSSTDNGATFDQGASDYQNQLLSAVGSSIGAARQPASSYGQISGFISGRILLDILDFGVAGEGASGLACVTVFDAGGIYIQNTGQFRASTTARNAIRFGPTAAVTMSGRLSIWGTRT